MTYWVPKSQVIEVSEVDELGMHHRDALIGMSYDEVYTDWKAEMSLYK